MTRQKHNLDTMHEYAKVRGGTCLSVEYSGIRGDVKFRCQNGHEWVTKPIYAVYKRHWCPTCGGIKTVPHTLDNFKELAASRGGKCLSDVYKGVHRHLTFKCKDGHVWEAEPANLLHRDSWCPVCAKEQVGRRNFFGSEYIDEMKRIAAQHLGKCFSNVYLGDKVHLLFECADGHRWWATPNTIKRPHWCPLCKNGKPRSEIVFSMAVNVAHPVAMNFRSKEIANVMRSISEASLPMAGVKMANKV